jgi:hypothetical protein
MVLFVCVFAYTAIVSTNHGLGLLPIFFGDIMAMGWPGQFNVDFTGFLTLAAVWVAWRHHFSTMGLVLAVVAFFGGSLFLTAYLFIASLVVRGDAVALLVGPGRRHA